MTAQDTTNRDEHDAFRDFLVKVLENEEEVLVTGAQKVGVNRLFVTFRGKAMTASNDEKRAVRELADNKRRPRNAHIRRDPRLWPAALKWRENRTMTDEKDANIALGNVRQPRTRKPPATYWRMVVSGSIPEPSNCREVHSSIVTCVGCVQPPGSISRVNYDD